MRSRLLMVVLVGALLGAAGLAYAASRQPRPYVFTLGVPATGPVSVPAPGQEACQSPVGIPDPVDRVTVFVGPFKAPRGPYRVALRAGDPSGPVLSSATVERRFLPSGPTTVRFDRPFVGGENVALCIRNDGLEPMEVIGDIDSHTGLAPPKVFAGRTVHNPTRTTDDLYLDGEAVSGGGFEMAAEFPLAEPQSLLEQLPAAFRHAARFKIDGTGAWTYWLLLGLALLAAPIALGRALGAAFEEDTT